MSLTLLTPRDLNLADIFEEAAAQELGLVIYTTPPEARSIEAAIHRYRVNASDPALYEFTVHGHVGGEEIWLIRKNNEVLE